MWSPVEKSTNDNTSNDALPHRRTVLKAIGAGVGSSGLAMLSGRVRTRESQAANTVTLVPVHGRVSGELPNTITIKAHRVPLEYQFSVSGRVEKGPNAGNTDRIVDGNVVHGVINNEGELDNYRFSGRITAFRVLKGEIRRLTVNGREVEVPGERPDTGEQEPDRVERDCVSLEPLSHRNQTIEEFYGYRPNVNDPNPRQSNTPTNLERPGVSRLFLYQGPRGLSLVIIHGGGDGEEGGAATFEFTGLPTDGRFVVEDDGYPGATDTFTVTGDRAVVDWAWGVQGRNDGGAFRPLGNRFAIRIEPAFNDAAALDPFGPGEVTRWEILSGSAENPDAFEVPLDRPVMLQTGSCD